MDIKQMIKDSQQLIADYDAVKADVYAIVDAINERGNKSEINTNNT